MVKQIGIGLVGAGWMGNVHSRGYREVPTLMPPLGAEVRLAHVADEAEQVAEAARARWGYERASTDWRVLTEDPRVDVVDVTGPNHLHREVIEAAANAGKTVYCEKPGGLSLADITAAAEAVRRAGAKSFTGYNYRWLPALRHARDLIAEEKLGMITHFRAQFLTSWGLDPHAPYSWRFDRERAGWGVLGDLGGHVIDTAEFLLGPISDVVGIGETFVPRRPAPLPPGSSEGISVFSAAADSERLFDVTNEDYFSALVRFECGALGTIELSRTVAGPKNPFRVGLNGTTGAFSWDLERLNEFELYRLPSSRVDADDGFCRVLTNPHHPGYGLFSPAPGLGPSFADSKTAEIYSFLSALVRGEQIEPTIASSLRVATVLDALHRSWETGNWQRVVATPQAALDASPVTRD